METDEILFLCIFGLCAYSDNLKQSSKQQYLTFLYFTFHRKRRYTLKVFRKNIFYRINQFCCFIQGERNKTRHSSHALFIQFLINAVKATAAYLQKFYYQHLSCFVRLQMYRKASHQQHSQSFLPNKYSFQIFVFFPLVSENRKKSCDKAIK